MEDMLQYADMNPDSRIARRMKAAVTQNEAVLNAWVDAVSGGVENFNLQDGQKNDAQGGVKFSIRNTSSMSLQDQIKAYHNGKLQSSDAFYFGEAPKTLNKIGITRPLAMSQTDYAKSAKYKHNTKRRNFLAVSSNLASPMFSFSIDGKHGIVVDDYDGDGNKLLIAIHENKISGHDNVDAIKSIYGIQNPAEWLNNQIKSGATFTLFDEKRANTFLHSYGYSASLKEGIHSTEDNVTQQAENVNGILKSSRNQTKTENFKRWFGDWQNDPQNASKVVNADGTPKRLYRYTNLEYTVIKPDYRGAIWMADNDWVTSQYGSCYDVLYANMRNPYVFNVDGLDFSEETALVNARKGGHDGLIIHFKFTGENNDYYQFMVENAPNTKALRNRNSSTMLQNTGMTLCRR